MAKSILDKVIFNSRQQRVYIKKEVLHREDLMRDVLIAYSIKLTEPVRMATAE